MSTQSPFFGKRTRDAEADPHMDFSPSAAATDGGSKLIVGPNIKLKGVEITDCDTLEVEGVVEASMDARVMKIAEQGVFKGSAQFDLVTIHGQFDGRLTVRPPAPVPPPAAVQAPAVPSPAHRR